MFYKYNEYKVYQDKVLNSSSSQTWPIFTAAEHGLRNYATVFPILTLRQLAEKTPLTVEEMTEKVDGLPKAKVNKYGAERFLDITKNYHLIMSSKWQM